MKITATKEQICEILSRAVGSTVTDFCVCNPVGRSKAFANKFRVAIKELNYLGNQKIEAIKKLREIAGNRKEGLTYTCKIRLDDAKWAVENWEKWIAFVELNGRLPKDEYMVNGILK